MYCPKCGYVMDESHKYCPSCGKAFGDEFGYEGYKKTQEPYKRTRPIWFYLLVGMTLLLCFWGFYSIFTSGQKLETIVMTQLADVQEHQITKAYYEYGSSEFKKNTSLNEFRDLIKKFPALSDPQKIEILDRKKENSFGVVFAKVIPSKGAPIRMKYEFVKEDGIWRILNIQIDDQVYRNQDADAGVMKVITEQLKDLSSSKAAEAYESFGASAFKKATTEEEFQRFVEQFPQFQNFKDVSFPQQEKSENKVIVTALIQGEDRVLPVEYILVNEDGQWKIWSMRVINFTTEEGAYQKLDVQALRPSVEIFIHAIGSGNSKEAYESTASGFKVFTTYDDFKSFVERFPVFKKEDYKVLSEDIDKGIGKVQLELNDNGKTLIMEYTLSRENGIWKVLGMQVLEKQLQVAQPKSAPQEFDSSFLTDIISDQLRTLREQDFYNAYTDYTSTQFKESTPFEQFARFVNQNVVFSNNASAEFENLTFNNNIATITGFLTAQNGDSAVVEYNLIKEDDEWKILGIKIVSNEGASQ